MRARPDREYLSGQPVKRPENQLGKIYEVTHWKTALLRVRLVANGLFNIFCHFVGVFLDDFTNLLSLFQGIVVDLA